MYFNLPKGIIYSMFSYYKELRVGAVTKIYYVSRSNTEQYLTIGCCTAGWSGLSMVRGGCDDGRLVGWGLGSGAATVLLAAAILTPPAGLRPRYVCVNIHITSIKKMLTGFCFVFGVFFLFTLYKKNYKQTRQQNVKWTDIWLIYQITWYFDKQMKF